MTPSNFHTHTRFCDGNDTPEELVLEAIRLGCGEIGFSGHSYTPFDEVYCMSPRGTKEYVETITELKKKYQGRIRIFLGLEQDYYSDPPDFQWDYLIGSVHYVKKDGVFLAVDDTPEILEQGVQTLYHGDYYRLAEDYYQTVADLYRKTGCNIIGHFDIIRKFNRDDRLFDTRDPRYVSAYRRALDCLFATDCAFEINTHGSSAFPDPRNYPESEIEAILRANHRRLVYSSDCHRKERLLSGIPAGWQNLPNIPRIKSFESKSAAFR